LRVSDEFWTTLNKFNKLVEPFSILTKRLQDEQLTIPDFNEFWMTAMLSSEVISGWDPAQKLKSLLNGRREKIGENPIIQAGIYLDPRFRSISLSGISQNSAKQVIRAIFMKNAEHNESSFQVEENETSEILNPVQALISSHFSSQDSAASMPLQEIDSQLKLYEEFKFDKASIGKLDVVSFWREQFHSASAPLNKLATVALDIICVPVTEVTAERLFSNLSFVFNKHRSSLKSEIIEDILFCRWNQKSLNNE
jgi:hAT family C-terminal dimerisation region